jgi:hypothetical protein
VAEISNMHPLPKAFNKFSTNKKDWDKFEKRWPIRKKMEAIQPEIDAY